MTSKEIRESFLKFFSEKQHKIVPSAPMVIKDDPTLMFTNAGMNQFKDIILGNKPIKYPRVADSQKCLRVSGKHNDLEEVGYDTYHHTMFEMLGNWSFGDYFKEKAIEWAWSFLTDVLKLEKDRIYVTVFEGSSQDKLERDDEAARIWEKYLDKKFILNGSKKDNFWEMGDVGPCGPCSEIHLDLRSDKERREKHGTELVNKDHPQVIEVWNLVFMQFDRHADGSLHPLPAKVIDTGMGFERLCMAVQGKQSNYDTDIFQIIIKAIGELTNHKYGDSDRTDIAMRVIADHIRTIAFSITDGQLPSNAKAGYVIRRILRRAVRYGYTFLNQQSAFMYKLIPALIESMGEAYPELTAQKALIEKVIKEEEESFLKTLETGIRLLDKQIDELKATNKKVLDGNTAFTLYDTYGFPLDLTELILRESNLSVDIAEFDKKMQEQKDRARKAAHIETDDWVILKNINEVEFVGYDAVEAACVITRYRKIKQKGKEYYQIVLDATPFYPEMGGQVGDTGWIIDSEGNKTDIIDTKNENSLIVHISEKLPQDVHGEFKAKINLENRIASECNHTATHLLQEALRQVLGEHVEQKGSYVSPKVLRFDFSHFQKLTPEEIRKVEESVNKKIRENISRTECRNIPIDEAKAMGATALFGEKYGDNVRVIQYGSSIELCGGTHVKSTGNIGNFRIISESSIAAGIRRIEAVTAEECEKYLYAIQDTLEEVKHLMNNTPNVLMFLKKQMEENCEMKKRIETFTKEKAMQIISKVQENSEIINGITIYRLEGLFPTEMVKNISMQFGQELSGLWAFIAVTEFENKPMITLALSKDLTSGGHNQNASKIIKEAAKLIQGGGGGQPHLASAGGKNIAGLSSAFQFILDRLTK